MSTAGKVGLELLPFKLCKGSLGVLGFIDLRCQGLGKMRQMRQYKLIRTPFSRHNLINFKLVL